MVERFYGWVDRLVPPGSDPTVTRRTRLVIVLSASMFFWVVVFFALAVAAGANRTGLAIVGVGGVLALAPFTIVRFGGQVGGHVTAASVYLIVVAVACLNGGTTIQMHYGMVVVPVLAGATAGVWAGVGWGIVVVATNIALFEAQWLGWRFPLDVPVGYFEAFQLCLSIAVPVVLICFVAFYEYTREATTRELLGREHELAAIIDTAQDGLLVLQRDGRLDRVNPAAERLFAATPDQLVGATARQLFAGGLALAARAELTDVRARRWDGTEFPADITIGSLSTADGQRFVAIVRDVTSRHEAARAVAEARDRAVEANRAKSAFLANMSHELRTPLNAILGYAELIVEEVQLGSPEEVPGDADRIISSGRHLLALIDNVLDLSKVEAGKLVLDHQALPLDEFLQGVVASLEPVAAGRQNQLVLDVPEAVGTIEADPVRLRQVVLNLLSNALKFTERGVVTLRAARVSFAGRPWIRLEVEDTGIGMTPAQLERIFDDFVQADASTTRRFGGTGLGLAISRRLVRMMGGEIGVRSEPGVGSAFTLEIPA